MSEQTNKSLSGFWTGVYDYTGAATPVPFNAILDDREGALSGEIIEPNTFAEADEVELFSSLSGGRDGEAIEFWKQYEALPGAGHIVRYVGVVLDGGRKIVGRWSIGARWSGPFVMNRGESAAGLEIWREESVADDAPR